MAWPVRRYFRLLWCTLCLLTFLALPVLVWQFQKQHYNVHRQAWFIGGIFAILSVPISIYEIALHIEYYTQPHLQKHVIRILLMVPIYAVDAWLALKFKKAREYLDPVRECYEAFVVYSFLAYLMAFLQDTYKDLDEHMRSKRQVQHLFVARWLLRPWDMGTRYLWECKKGVLNFVILRPVCTALAFFTDIFDQYGRGQINFKKSYVYLAAVTNFSQMWALYCLVMLYTAMHSELAPIRPLSKFLCIKAVIFVTFWQSIAIAILVYAGVIRQESWYDTRNVAAGLQDFLICIEMFLAALAHAYAFPPRDYMESGHSAGFFANVVQVFNWWDVAHDVKRVMKEHVSTATTAVVEAPRRAVKKAARGLARNTWKLFTAAGKGSPGGRSTDDEEQAACFSGALLLRPTSSNPGLEGGSDGESDGDGDGDGDIDISYSRPMSPPPQPQQVVASLTSVVSWPTGVGVSGGGGAAAAEVRAVGGAASASATVAVGVGVGVSVGELKEPLLTGARSSEEGM